MFKRFFFYLSFFILSLVLVKTIDLGLSFFVNEQQNSLDTEIRNDINRNVVLREFSPNQDYYLTPSKDYVEASKNLERKPYRMRTDENGFIIGSQNIKSQGEQNLKTDIIFFGGSTTECIYVEEFFRFPHYVSVIMSQKLRRSIVTLNAGFSGNHSMHSLINLIAKGLVNKPKFVILMNAANDVGTFSKTVSYWKAPKRRALIQEEKLKSTDLLGVDEVNIGDSVYILIHTISKRVKDLLIPNSWILLRPLIVKIKKENFVTEGTDEWEGYRTKKDFKTLYTEFEKQFTFSLKSFIKISKIWGIEPILMTQFSRWTFDNTDFKKLYEEKNQSISFDNFIKLYQLSNQLIKKVSKEENILLIDLEKVVPKDDRHIYDTLHLSKEGSILVSKIISDKMIENFYRIQN